ncbi:MAG: PQQ-binding-like beta-propeller repeat protein [Dehalococcoidales bacterium]
MKKKKSTIFKAALAVLVLFVSFFTAGCSSSAYVNYGWTGSVVDGDTIFVASQGKITALQKDNGSVKWQREIEKDTAPSGSLGCGMGASASVMYADPLVYDDVVYVATYTGKIFAFATASGNLLWKYPVEGNVAQIIGDLLIDEGKLYFAAVGGVVTALDLETRAVVWEYDTKDTIWASPSVNGNTLFVASYGKKLFAIDKNTGEPKWSKPFETQGPITAAPGYDNGVVYIASLDRGIYAISAETGALIWEFNASSNASRTPKNWFWATPLLVNGVIYAPNMDGFVYIIDAADGKLMNALELGTAVSSNPVLNGEWVLVATQHGALYSINISNNTKVLLRSLDMTIQSSLYVDEGIVYVHTIRDENLYAINAGSGVMVWYYEVS